MTQAIKNIQPFIDLGWHTLPLKGELKRLETGKKTIPEFPGNWLTKFTNTLNTIPTHIGGVLTGKVSNIVAIDCDNQATFDLMHALDPTNTFIFVSKGKLEGGGTIIYKYSDTLPSSFKIHNDLTSLDFLSNGRMTYLPTEQNESKEQFNYPFPEIKELPANIVQLLNVFYTSTKVKAIDVDTKTTSAHLNYKMNLYPQVKQMLDDKKVRTNLFKILTPKSFRQLPEYVKKGYLLPSQIPDGHGSEYLSKVSAILGADISIDQETYITAMEFINNSFTTPMDINRLHSTVTDPMLQKSASINNKPIWDYDENWQQKGFSVLSKQSEIIDTYFDDVRNYYLVNNPFKNLVKVFDRESDCFSYLSMISSTVITKQLFKNRVPLVKTHSDPSRDFGLYEDACNDTYFNMFRPSRNLQVIQAPAINPDYKEPTLTLKYLETLIPDEKMRRYLLGFIKRKLITFDYSPVILYFLGAHGSGKDTFINLLSLILGVNYIGRPSAKEFLEQYNGWLIDKYFVQLDEYGNQLNKLTDKQEALGKLKAYTGKPVVQIRRMRTDGFEYKHNSTFILTANTNPLPLEADDRRVALFETPNKLATADWVIEAGGISEVINKLEDEIFDFCTYIGREVKMLTPDEYTTPPDTQGKKELIANKLGAGDMLGYYIINNMYDALMAKANEYDVDLNSLIHDGRIAETDLFILYDKMTEGSGTLRGLSTAMRLASVIKIPSTKDGKKVYYFKLNEFKNFESLIQFPTEVDTPSL